MRCQWALAWWKFQEPQSQRQMNHSCKYFNNIYTHGCKHRSIILVLCWGGDEWDKLCLLEELLEPVSHDSNRKGIPGCLDSHWWKIWYFCPCLFKSDCIGSPRHRLWGDQQECKQKAGSGRWLIEIIHDFLFLIYIVCRTGQLSKQGCTERWPPTSTGGFYRMQGRGERRGCIRCCPIAHVCVRGPGTTGWLCWKASWRWCEGRLGISVYIYMGYYIPPESGHHMAFAVT